MQIGAEQIGAELPTRRLAKGRPAPLLTLPETEFPRLLCSHRAQLGLRRVQPPGLLRRWVRESALVRTQIPPRTECQVDGRSCLGALQWRWRLTLVGSLI